MMMRFALDSQSTGKENRTGRGEMWTETKFILKNNLTPH